MARPRKRITAPRSPVKGEEMLLDNPEVRETIREMAFNGYFDSEIAAKIGVAKSTFCTKKQLDNEFAELLETARARAKENETEFPSLALFREMWNKCDGKRSKLMELFGIGWTTLQSWFAQEPRFLDIIAERDLPFLEQLDIAGRIMALGGVRDKDTFPGWSRHPDMWQLRWYLNTLGKKYGYGETPVMPEVEGAVLSDVEQGVNIEDWIIQEMTAKKNLAERAKADAAEGADSEAGAAVNQDKEVADDTEP